jgi:hypothetical protein
LVTVKVPIKVKEVKVLPDGSAELQIEFDEDIKRVLMKAWGVQVWDEQRAQREFAQVIRESLSEENSP